MPLRPLLVRQLVSEKTKSDSANNRNSSILDIVYLFSTKIHQNISQNKKETISISKVTNAHDHCFQSINPTPWSCKFLEKPWEPKS